MPTEERIQTEKGAIAAIAAVDEWKFVSLKLPDGKTVRLKLFKLRYFDLKKMVKRLGDIWDKLSTLGKQLTETGKVRFEFNIGDLAAEAPVLVEEFFAHAYGLNPQDYEDWGGDIYLELLAEAVNYNILGNERVMNFFGTMLSLKQAEESEDEQNTKSLPNSSDGDSG